MSESDYKSSKQKVPELPSELRRAAKISTSGYWAGVLLEAADEIEAARRQDETFARQPSDCKHEHADIRCSDCGIDFRRVSHSDSFAPLLAAANEVLANFMPSFGGSREVDDCLVQLAAAVADAEKARPSEKASEPQVYTQEALDEAHERTRQRLAKLKVE